MPLLIKLYHGSKQYIIPSKHMYSDKIFEGRKNHVQIGAKQTARLLPYEVKGALFKRAWGL